MSTSGNFIDYVNVHSTDWIEKGKNDLILAHNPVFNKIPWPLKTTEVFAILCEKGTAEVSIEGERIRLDKNGFLIVLAGQMIDCFKFDDEFECTYISFSDDFLLSLDIGDAYKFYKSVQSHPYVILQNPHYYSILHYIGMARSMISVSHLHPNVNAALRLLTKAFFLMLGWAIHPDAVKYEMGLTQSDLTGHFVNLVKKNFRSHRDVEFYADKMNVTAKYLSSVIKKTTGVSPLHLIEEQVIIEAKSLLSSSNRSIKEISDELEFPSQSFFGRYFKRATGISPSDYRKSARINSSRNQL